LLVAATEFEFRSTGEVRVTVGDPAPRIVNAGLGGPTGCGSMGLIVTYRRLILFTIHPRLKSFKIKKFSQKSYTKKNAHVHWSCFSCFKNLYRKLLL